MPDDTAAPAVEVSIERLGAHGDGVAHHGATRLYVPHTVPGDRVRVRPGPAKGDGATATLEAVVAHGPHRVTPFCAHHGHCGGCTVQHLAGDAYRAWKRDVVTGALARQGLEVSDRVDALVVPETRTRRRAGLSAVRSRDGVILGFAARRSHHVSEAADCPLLDPAIRDAAEALRPALGRVLSRRGRADVLLTVTETGVDAVITADRAPDAAGREALAAAARRGDLAQLSLRRGDDHGFDPILQERPPRATFGGVTVDLPPGPFLQASPEVEERLGHVVTEAVLPAGPALDLFSGCGTFTFPLAQYVTVQAVDGTAEALAAVKRAAARTGAATRVGTTVRDLERNPMQPRELSGYRAVVMDPPRAGAKPQARALARAAREHEAPGVVVMISCSPGTFARDVRLLTDAGYRLERVTPIDQFPWSAHVELAGVLRW